MADELSGASRGSAEPIHNRVVVTGTDSSGNAVKAERYAAELSLTSLLLHSQADVSLPNPSFDINTSGWTVVRGTLARDTGTFQTAPASGKVTADVGLGNGVVESAFTGTFRRGITYVVEYALQPNHANGILHTAALLPVGSQWNETAKWLGYNLAVLTPGSQWTVHRVAFTPRQDTPASGVKLTFEFTSNSPATFLDSAQVFVGKLTMPDRRGFIRTRGIRVSRAITPAVAVKLADAALRDAMRTPFKGTLTAHARTVRTFLGDAPVHPAHLLRHTGELVHASHLIDPDTGNLGRDARIAAVTFDEEAGTAEVTLDHTRQDFERLLANYEVTGRFR